MLSALRTGLYSFLLLAGLGHAGVVKNHGALKVQGNRIVDASGNPIQLAGMSLYWSVWGGEKYFTAGVVGTMANQWSSSLIRAPAGVISGGGQNVYTYPGTENLIKTVVDAAIANDIYVIVDWHLESGDPDQVEATQFFNDMTSKYKNTPNIIWEIWNEPKTVAWSAIKTYADAMIPLIRKNSSNLIIVGTPNWSHNPDQVLAAPITVDPNVAYTLHFYANQNSNGNIDADNNSAMAAADKAIKTLPLFITEWGTVGNSGGGPVNTVWSDKWLAWAKTNGVSWANWSLCAQSETSAALKAGASTNGGWTDANLTESGLYIKGKIAQVVPSTSALEHRPLATFSARRTSRDLDITLPRDARRLSIFDLRGNRVFQQTLSGQDHFVVPSAGSSTLMVRVETSGSGLVARLAPVR